MLRPGRQRTLELVGVALLLAIVVVITALVASSRPGEKTTRLGQIGAPIVVQHGQWQCSSPQDGTVVIVQDPVNADGVPYSAAVTLGNGCTGTIGAIIVQGNQRDGIKVGGTARDIEILSGWVACGPRKGTVHQDGVQAGGGSRVHFHNLHVDCPQSNNAGFFINQTNGGSGVRPTDITCTDCDLLAANNALNVGADSTDSGARYSILRQGTGSSAPATCKRVNGEGAVDQDNLCIPPNPEIDTGQPLVP